MKISTRFHTIWEKSGATSKKSIYLFLFSPHNVSIDKTADRTGD